jgi:hypothetical protein
MQRSKPVYRTQKNIIIRGNLSYSYKTPTTAFTSMTCPCCHHRFIDRNSRKKVYVYEENDPDQPPWEPDYAMKCKVCKHTLLLFNKTPD